MLKLLLNMFYKMFQTCVYRPLIKYQCLSSTILYYLLYLPLSSNNINVINSQSSNMLNQARLKVLKVREDHVRNVLDEARKRLAEVPKNNKLYSDLLVTLIVQALFQVNSQTYFIVYYSNYQLIHMSKEWVTRCDALYLFYYYKMLTVHELIISNHAIVLSYR